MLLVLIQLRKKYRNKRGNFNDTVMDFIMDDNFIRNYINTNAIPIGYGASLSNNLYIKVFENEISINRRLDDEMCSCYSIKK